MPRGFKPTGACGRIRSSISRRSSATRWTISRACPASGPRPRRNGSSSSARSTTLIANADEAAGGPKTKQALKDAIANGNLAKSRRLVDARSQRAADVRLGKWQRKDWDGQRLLELFHEFGFRSFAERVRKTLTTSGAKKNEEALADGRAGISAFTAGAVQQAGLEREETLRGQGGRDSISSR